MSLDAVGLIDDYLTKISQIIVGLSYKCLVFFTI